MFDLWSTRPSHISGAFLIAFYGPSNVSACLCVYIWSVNRWGLLSTANVGPVHSSRIPTTFRWMQMMPVGCWLVGKWAGKGKWTTAEFTRNGRSMKKINKCTIWKLQAVTAVDTSLFNTQFHFSSVDVRSSLSCAAGWWTSRSTSKSNPQTGWTTYFMHWLNQ